MSSIAAAPTTSTRSTTRLWQGALATGVLAGLAPRMNAVLTTTSSSGISTPRPVSSGPLSWPARAAGRDRGLWA
jgi:hypothetical protein